MKSIPSSSKRGSALLIVLGLLAFLIISAVAFSISMRTEKSAAASYRRNLLARELLSTAFADARATVNLALVSQMADSADPMNNISDRTIENLAPFKYPNSDAYGRLISSRNNTTYDATALADGNDVEPAYLLDGKVMAHIPPYVAYSVYDTLENAAAASGNLGFDGLYYIDRRAGWKPIVANIPTVSADDANIAVSGGSQSTAIVGRMAWAVINLSDSLDINAIGSASSYRGLGLTGSEFAFGTEDETKLPDGVYNLFRETKKRKPADSLIELPIFCSNADLAQFAARSQDSDLQIDSGNESPFSWQEALATQGDGFYSPFSVYSFWPSSTREKEASAPTEASEAESISCSDISEDALKTADAATSDKLISLAQGALGNTGAADTLVRLLADYIDQDSVPNGSFDDTRSGSAKARSANAFPTVENVPMLSEICYEEGDWATNGAILKKIEDAVEKALDEIMESAGKKTYDSAADIEESLKDIGDLAIQFPATSQPVFLRAYFPGRQTSTGSFTLTAEGDKTAGSSFLGLAAALLVDDKAKSTNIASVTSDLTLSNSAFSIRGDQNEEEVFESTPVQTLTSKEAKLTFRGADIPVAKSDADIKKVTINLLVDHFIRVACLDNKSEVVDLCPTDRGLTSSQYGKETYPKKATDRITEAGMRNLDSNYFRITRPISITFAFKWEIDDGAQDAQGNKTLKAELVLADKYPLEVSLEPTKDFKFTDKLTLTAPKAATYTPSYKTLSPVAGTWYTVDPRYNWISPMLGCSDNNTSDYFSGSVGTVHASFSSPHWVFVDGDSITSGGAPSSVQDAYASAHSSLVPFSWGLSIDEIRYGHNDSGQLFFPAELGFLPVPVPAGTLEPNPAKYGRNSFSSYHRTVAEGSFFRTLPVADLKDGISPGGTSYEKFQELVYGKGKDAPPALRAFGGRNFPEEHRSILNVFAGQDDYLLGQRLRQLALLGIPPTIKQAAYVTYQRLKVASGSDAMRISPDLLTDDLRSLEKLDFQESSLQAPKYDDFVVNYLFPLPQNRTAEWPSDARPQNLDFLVQDSSSSTSFEACLRRYNNEKSADQKLGQNDMTTLLAIAKECFGDRQQLFLYILRADFIAYNSARELSAHKPLSSARAVALVWRDAYGKLPDRVVYYQLIP